MAVKTRWARSCDRRGFTLVEVTVAASLLLLTVVCVTPLLVGSRWSTSREERAAEAGRLATSRLEHWCSLAFGPSAVTGGGETPASPDCAVAALFPHADPTLDEERDFVVLTDGRPWPMGSFVTRRAEGLFVITTDSRFGVATPAGFAPVPLSRLTGYDTAAAGSLPSGVLLVTVRVSWTERGIERSVVRRAVLQEGSLSQAESSAGPS